MDRAKIMRLVGEILDELTGIPGPTVPAVEVRPVPPEPFWKPGARQLSSSFTSLNMRIELPTMMPALGQKVFVLKSFFSTVNGSWEPDAHSDLASWRVEPWARAKYLKALGAADYFDEAGADHHLFARVIGWDGQVLADMPVRYWTPGFEGNDVVYRAKRSGWSCHEVYQSSVFHPAQGRRGVWAWQPDVVNAEALVGGGMPNGQHVSFFAVWQEMVL